MAENRLNRELQTREKTVRKRSWVRPRNAAHSEHRRTDLSFTGYVLVLAAKMIL
jgi:hypothetical protein